nr:E3 ubiquitin-protein ligase ZNF598-like [Aedes albopictus]
MAIHRRIGNPDIVGHRGHPLCEYCDKLFLDKDELFRHLRKMHLFCHFCDADGTNYFYGDNESSERAGIVYGGVPIGNNLRAHRASAHGKSKNKLTNKQTRTLELEFSYRHSGSGPLGSGPGGGRNRGGENSDRGDGGGHRGGYDTQRDVDAICLR